MPILKKCCFVIDLPLGGIILGSLSLLAYAIVAILFGLGLFATYQKEVEDSLMDKYEKTPEVLPAARFVLWIAVIICLLLAMVSVLMIVGSQKVTENPFFRMTISLIPVYSFSVRVSTCSRTWS